MFVQNVNGQVRNGLTYDAAFVGFHILQRNGTIGNVDGGFGDAVHIDQLRLPVAVFFKPRAQTVQFQRLAAKNDVTQIGVKRRLADLLFGLNELTESRRRLIEHGYLLLDE